MGEGGRQVQWVRVVRSDVGRGCDSEGGADEPSARSLAELV